jgi:hypothetical protein
MNKISVSNYQAGKSPSLLNIDLIGGKRLQSKRRGQVRKTTKNSVIEGFTGYSLPPIDKSEFNTVKTFNQKLQGQLSQYATNLKTVLSDYQVGMNNVKNCYSNCKSNYSGQGSDIQTLEQQDNALDNKSACIAGCNLSKVYLWQTTPAASYAGTEGTTDTFSSCAALEKDGPEYCRGFYATSNCCDEWGDGDGCDSRDNQVITECNTSVPSNLAGSCVCKNGETMATVNCGHQPFTCNEVCQPGGKPYNTNPPSPVPTTFTPQPQSALPPGIYKNGPGMCSELSGVTNNTLSACATNAAAAKKGFFWIPPNGWTNTTNPGQGASYPSGGCYVVGDACAVGGGYFNCYDANFTGNTAATDSIGPNCSNVTGAVAYTYNANAPPSSGAPWQPPPFQSKCTGLMNPAFTACQCVENLPAGQCTVDNWATGVYQKCKLGGAVGALKEMDRVFEAAIVPVETAMMNGQQSTQLTEVTKFCNTYNKASATQQ